MKLDSPKAWQWYMQDSGNIISNGIHDLHNLINYYLLMILVGVIYMLLITIYRSTLISSKYITHGKWLELIWTLSPGLLLLTIAYPSFKLLYMLDSMLSADLTVKLVGHQWYWSVELSDYGDSKSFDSYLLSNLENGEIRLLDVDNSLVIPIDTNIRIIVSSSDVIHDLAIPSLGLKLDAIPGRLNETLTSVNRIGKYYGQCSELCGAEHGFIPISIESTTIENYIIWLETLKL